MCHHYGSDSADHIIPRTEDPTRALDTSNLKAVHHKPCPTCSQAAGSPIRCNLLRGAMSVERARRIIEKRTGLDLGADKPDKPAVEGREF